MWVTGDQVKIGDVVSGYRNMLRPEIVPMSIRPQKVFKISYQQGAGVHEFTLHLERLTHGIGIDILGHTEYEYLVERASYANPESAARLKAYLETLITP